MRKTKAEAMKTREYLMLAALDTFYRRGVARASLNEIAQTAGVTRGALYWHFKNKEDLFDALFQYIFDDYRQRMAEDIASGSPDTWENLRQALLNMFDRLQHNEIHRKFMSILHLKCEHTERNEAIVNLMTQYTNLWHDQLGEALKLCVRQQKLPADLNIDFAVVYLKSICTGLAQIWLSAPDRFDLEKTAPMMVNTAMNTLQQCPTLHLPA